MQIVQNGPAGELFFINKSKGSKFFTSHAKRVFVVIGIKPGYFSGPATPLNKVASKIRRRITNGG